MVIRRIHPLPVAKLAGLLYAIIGFIIGLLFAVIGMLGAGAMGDSEAGALPGMFFGVGAIVLLPLLYGCLGFVMTAFVAWLYNVAAGMVGGIEIDVDQR